MADHIPFVTGEDGCKLVRRLYADSDVVRIPLDRSEKFLSRLRPDVRSKIWLDPCVDGLDDVDSRRGEPKKPNPWFQFMSSLPHFEKISSPGYWPQPASVEVSSFVTALLDRCVAAAPAWITVPQIPLADAADRNKINRALALATGNWESHSGFTGQLILPLIVTRQEQVNGKTARNPKIRQAERCYNEAHADGFWVVDKSLTDDSGSPTLRNKRFPGLVAFHEELNKCISSKIRIAGPYWGLNLVLWARGLVDFPAVGVGSGYQYFLSGGHANPPSARIALPSLRRRAGVGPQLKTWLEKVAAILAPSHPASREFNQIKSQYDVLNAQERAREQVAAFYKRWFDIIASAPKAGRSMALFQDLSAAYALGKSLPDLEDEGTGRRPEAIAEPLMLSCL
jgi:hypothetical protein